MNYTPGQILNNKQEYKDFANWTAVHPEAKLSARALGNYTYEIYALPEPPAPTKEEQEQARKAAYTAEIDPLHARKMRKTILGEWTEEDETEYLEQVRTLSAEIVERYPYPTDPITESEENADTQD